MSSDTMYFNRSRMLPAHNKNKAHITQTPPLSMKKSKSNRKSLELVEKKSEKDSRASTPVPVDLKLTEIPQLQSLPNGERPNFGNTSNSNVKTNDNKDISHQKAYSRKKSGSGKTHKIKDKDGEKKSKSNKKDKHSSSSINSKKDKQLKHESTEVVTTNLKQLLFEKNNKNRTNDSRKKSVKNDSNINRVQNNPSPLTTFLTSPIITPDNIPPQLKINNNPTTLGQTPLMVSMQHNQQFTHQNDHNVAVAAGHNNNNNTNINNHNNNNIPIPLTNGMVNSPIMHPLTPFQMSNTIPPYPFGNNNMNYSISNVPLPLPIPSYVSPQPIPPQQNLLNGNNPSTHNIMMDKTVDISGGGGVTGPVMANNNTNINKPVNVQVKNNNKSIKNTKNVNKKIPHSFAGASFATDIPQECNLPKPSFL